MKISLDAGPGLEHTLPGGAPGTVDLPDGSTVADAVALLDTSSLERFLTALNEDVVVKSQRDSAALSDGDTVSILPPLTGG